VNIAGDIHTIGLLWTSLFVCNIFVIGKYNC